MANHGVKWLPSLYVCSNDIEYDITTGSPTITALKVACAADDAELYFDTTSGTYNILNGVTVAAEDGLIDNNENVEEKFVASWKAVGLDASTDQTARAALIAVNTSGVLYNLFLFDDKHPTAGLAVTLYNCKVRAKQTISPDGKEYFECTATQVNGGDAEFEVISQS